MADDTIQDDSAGAGRYVSPRKKRGKPKPKMQPPLTPMIDVTFQLLLFFLLTMTFRLEEGMIPGALPQKGAGESSIDILEEPITILLTPYGENGQDVKFEIDGASKAMYTGRELYDFFRARIDLGVSLESPVVIAPNRAVRWRWVVEVFNQAHSVEFKEIGFAPASG